MKVIILNGSARGSKGVTWRLLEAFVGGLEEAGAEATCIQLNELSISCCTACLTCMHKTPGRCAIKDDMDRIYPYLKSCDVFVMGTPVYTDNMSAQMKTVMDRCICCLEPFLRIDDAGRIRHPFSWTMPAGFFLVSTSGFPEAETFQSLVSTFRGQAANFGAKPIGEICIPGSIALQVALHLLEPRLALIRQAGDELGRTGEVAPTLLDAINKPILTCKQYLEISSRYEDWARKHRGGAG